MRFLNKIIFINSAHIPYAEIRLDGNVHFIGTQGVGKSTLLRAILFFYNVDKSRLGIRTQDKQKSYDEFYFPYRNSYVIYEVERENGKFFVMTFVSNGRVAFRIVDCPYEKHFFFDADNSVRDEWGRISEQIGAKVFRSNIIRGYEEFRDIIYGNAQNVIKELRRFCLMESSRYQNVPRTIQNIFLNQSLESRVIKDTVIDSMDFAGDGIDLNFYREHVKDFRQQYEDIWKWYKTEKNGRVKVKTDADNVIDRYSVFEMARKAIKELCARLNFALERDTGRIPEIETEIRVLSQELERQSRLLAEENGKYDKEKDELKGKIAVIAEFLKQAKNRAQYYSGIGIDTIVSKVRKEKELIIREKSLCSQENSLTDRNRSVKARYDAIFQDLENSLKEFSLQAGQQINGIESHKTEQINALHADLASSQNELVSLYQKKTEELQETLDSARQEKSDLKLQEQKIRQYNPFEKEMESLSYRIEEMEIKKLSLERDLEQKNHEITLITGKAEADRKELETVCDKDLTEISHERQWKLQEADRLKERLDRQKGSFMEWLDVNLSGWKDTVGRIVDDEVLYSTSLDPKKARNSDSLYGVRIELQNVSKTVNTPEEIRARLDALEHEIQSLDLKADERKARLEDDIREMERVPAAKLKTLRRERIDTEAEIRQIPERIGRVKREADEYGQRLKEWREREIAAITAKLEKAEVLIQNLNAGKQQMAAQKQKETEELRKSFERHKREIDETAEKDKDAVFASVRQHQEETESHRKETEARMDAELKGLGVDVARLNEIRVELQTVRDDLHFIEIHKPDYYAWLKDREEYLEVEPSKKEERKRLHDRLEDLQQKFNLRKEKKEAEIHTLDGRLRSLCYEQETLKEAVGKVREFISSQSCPVDIAEAGNIEAMEPLTDILDSLRDNIALRQQRMEEFKKAVTVFKGNFSPQNTFHFRTEFNTDEDYIEFASELHEFISNRKIEEYRTRTSSQYANIIKRIAREVGDLNQHNADIKSTINEINRDFRENNFAGVIKEIELRAVESSDRLMQQLLNIKRFDEENGFDIGSLNLFSNEDTLNRTNEQAVNLLMSLIDMLDAEQKRERITLSDTFKLEFKVKENDNDTNWVEKLSNVGSDGTDILVKSMVNIMLINVFKRKISRRFGDFKLHCMMDEIGKLHPDNVEGILKFANVRNIYLINSSPTTYNAQVYKYTYSLSKDEKSNTIVKTLLTIR